MKVAIDPAFVEELRIVIEFITTVLGINLSALSIIIHHRMKVHRL